MFWVGINYAQAQTPNTFSLKEAIDFAIKNNVSVQSAQTDNAIAKAKVKETIGIGLPQISAEAKMTHYFQLQPNFFTPQSPFLSKMGVPYTVKDGVITFPNLFQLQNSGTATATLNQLIFDGSYLVGLKAAKTYTELSERNITASKITVAENVSKAYYSVLVAEERSQLLDKNVARLDSMHKQTKAMLKNGLVEKIDVDRIEVSLNNIKIEQQKTSRLVQLSRELLAFQMGLASTKDLVLTEKLDKTNLDKTVVVNNEIDYTQRIEFQTINTQKALNQLEQRNIVAGYYPKLYGFASYGYITANPKFGRMFDVSNNWSDYSSAGFNLQIPIFDGFQKKYKYQQSRLTAKKLELGTEQLKQSISLQAKQSEANWLNSLETLSIQQRNMELAQQVVKVTKSKYQQGVGSNIEVVNAETSLKEAHTNYYGALYDALIAKIDLDKALGKLYTEQ